MNKRMRQWLHDVVVDYAPKSFLKNLMTCEEVSWYVTGAKPVPKGKKYYFFVHKLICEPCVNLSKQMKTMDRDLKKNLSDDSLSPSEQKASDALEEEIIKKYS